MGRPLRKILGHILWHPTNHNSNRPHPVQTEVDPVRQLKQLQEENARLKRLVADLTLDKTMLQEVLSKKY